MLTYKYRIYSNNKTLANAEHCLYLCHCLYNCALEERILSWRDHKKSLSYAFQSQELPELKEYFSEFKGVYAQTLQQVLKRLDRAYQYFFNSLQNGGRQGFPRFKSVERYNSFTLIQHGWKIDHQYLFISRIGQFKMHLSRPIQGIIKTVTIKRTPTNKWYVYFVCDNMPAHKLPKSNQVIGIDVGIKSYLTDSDGNKVENPKFLKNTLKELRIKQRKLSRAKKGSNRRKKVKLQVAKCHEKIANQRDDFLHKLSTDYVKNYDVIKVENLQIQNMVKNDRLSRDINDCAWGKFFELLKYKAEEAGREVIKVKPNNTSKKCSKCGSINHELKLSDRIWICENCGATHDRDENAAINIVNSEVRAEPSVANVSGYTKRRPRIVIYYNCQHCRTCGIDFKPKPEPKDTTNFTNISEKH